MIVCGVPFSPTMNLGAAYNEFMGLLPEGAWGALLDHDAVFTTRLWYGQLEEAIAFKPDAGLFVAVTNRIAPAWQQAGQSECHDMAVHRKFGAERAAKNRTLLDVTGTKGPGGVLMVLSKTAWRDVGGFPDGMACVDHAMAFAQRDAGRKVWLMEHVFLQHWRRANGDGPPKDIPRVASCPCRGLEIQPTVRVALQ